MAVLPHPNPFDHLRARVLLVQVFGLFLAVLVLIGFWAALHVNEAWLPLVQSGLNLVFYVWLAGLLVHQSQRQKLNWWALLGSPRVLRRWPRLVGLVLLLLTFSWGTFLVWMSTLSWVAPGVAQEWVIRLQAEPGLRSGWANVLQVITIAIAAPVVEEVAFRGVLLQRWATKWDARIGLVTMAVLFGSLHQNPLGLGMFGLVMGLLYMQFRSLWAPIFCHILNNSLVLLLPLVPRLTGHSNALLSLSDLRQQWVIGLVLLAIATPILWLYLRSAWPRHNAKLPYLNNLRHDDETRGMLPITFTPLRPLATYALKPAIAPLSRWSALKTWVLSRLALCQRVASRLASRLAIPQFIGRASTKSTPPPKP